jgi:hypothetical protein
VTARAPARWTRSKPRVGAASAGVGVEGLQRVAGDHASVASAPSAHGGPVDDVEQLDSGTAGGPLLVGALVGAGVGDHQVGGGEQRVEQQLAVLGAGVAVADDRVAAQQVVAVGRRCAGTRRRRGRARTRPGAARPASARACTS